MSINSKTARFTRDSGEELSDMDAVSRCGPMALDMKASGKITRRMEKESSGMLTETYSMASGRMIRQMDTAYTHMLTELSTKATGKMIFSMDMALRLGPTVHAMKDTIKKEKSMEEALTCGQMAPNTLVTGLITK